MITKISALDASSHSLKASKNQNVKKEQKAQNSISRQMPNYKMLGAMQSGINFKGKTELTELEKSIIGKNEIRIPNILDIKEDIRIPVTQTPKESQKLNMAGLNVIKSEDEQHNIYEISNSKGDKIFIGKFDKNKEEFPTITYKQGKYMPEITVKDESLDGKSIKMLAGSILKGKGFELKMPGQYEPTPSKGLKDISFTGKVVVTTLNKEPRTIKAVDKYVASGLEQETIEGDYADIVAQNNPTIIIPAGGFGERFKNITREYENKPSAKLPTSDNYRIIATTLNMAAAAKILKGDDNDEIIYISQKHEIPENENTYYSQMYKTDGGAIAEGLARDIIQSDRDAIILNADIFTNADPTRAYNALKTLPDAALVIPYYPVNPQRAKAFGLLGIEQDEDGNMQIKKFIEKPKYTDEPPTPQEFVGTPGQYDIESAKWIEVQTARDPNNEGIYLANPGMYFLSKEALKVLMAQGIIDSSQTGLGGNVMPKIVEMANEGKLVDKNGNKLKAYTVPLEAKGGKLAVWDDIGTAEAYLKLIKDVAWEVENHGTTEENKYYGLPEFVLNDFRDNVDLDTGIVYDSPKARKMLENFKEKYNIEDIRGNIFVAGNK